MPQFASDERGPKRQGVVGGYLSQELRPSIQVHRVRFVRLAVLALPAAEDTVRAEVDQPTIPLTCDSSQPMGQEGVDGDRPDDALRFGTLLDDADAVDDHGRTDVPDDALQRLDVRRVDAVQNPARLEERQLPERRILPRLAQRAPGVGEAVAEDLKHLVAEHAAPARGCAAANTMPTGDRFAERPGALAFLGAIGRPNWRPERAAPGG